MRKKLYCIETFTIFAEFRVNYGDNEMRIFFIYDGDTVVVLFNGFKKKTQKTPDRVERGLLTPTVATLYKIAAAMGLTVELRPI